jgi:hypothetical protein
MASRHCPEELVVYVVKVALAEVESQLVVAMGEEQVEVTYTSRGPFPVLFKGLKTIR